MNSAAGTGGGVEGHDPAEYGERIGGRYDEWYGAREDHSPVVGFLAAQAAGRPVLELGIGTGRIACGSTGSTRAWAGSQRPCTTG
jgi:hypothetical protein